jgi:DNA-binding Xre family transcriptional regulator
MKMGVSIRVAAQKKDIGQTEIARLTGLSRQTISRLWRGKGVKSVDFSTLEKIATILKCSPLDFLYVADD